VGDASGAILHSTQYAPYGEPFAATGSPQTAFGFTGELTDGNGLVYLRARYYAPGIGVFTALDPVEDGNRYAWVAGNVANRVDPSGMIGDGERWVILQDAEKWLGAAKRINLQPITKLSSEEFAVMVAAKFVTEDATIYSDPFSDGFQREVKSRVGLAAWVDQIRTGDAETSYGPGNIPLLQAKSAAEFWRRISGMSEGEVQCMTLFTNFGTFYYNLKERLNRMGFADDQDPDGMTPSVDQLIIQEMNG
jgi:RHS repeat-associated protein